MLDHIRSLFGNLSAQKLRTFLTILGITWGTVAVVVLMAFGVGFQKQTRKNMHGMGDGIVVLFGGRTTMPFEGFNDGRSINLRYTDAQLLSQRIPEIRDISPEYMTRRATARFDTSSTVPATTGVLPIYGDMRNVIPEPGGRFLNELDVERRRRVVVLGDQIKTLLFGSMDALHQQILLGGIPFTVVGVMEAKTQNSSYNSRDADRIFIPASTYQSIYGDSYVSNIIYKPRSAAYSKSIEQQVYEVLGGRYRFDPSDSNALSVWDTNEFEQMLDAMFVGISVFLAVVGGFTLVVGGVGVANIMYVVVRERTREIGVKRSLGARRRTIMFQFLMEAALIVSIGAILGLLLSAIIVRLAAMLPIQDAVGVPEISLQVAVGTVLLLGFVSLLAGYFPARRASALDPVDALRYGV